MAHSITYKPQGILLSSAIEDIGVMVDGDFVDVTLKTKQGTMLLSERYYAYGGKATLYNVNSLVETFMRSAGLAFANFTFSVLDAQGAVADSHTYRILYCDRFTVCSDTASMLAENFLTTLDIRRVAPDDVTSLFFFTKAGDSLLTQVSYRFRSASGALQQGELFIDADKMASNDNVYQVNISQSDVMKSVGDGELIMFTVVCGQRSVTCFIDRSLSLTENFLYRNCFNVWEVMSLPHSTIAKTEVERSTAVINNRTQHYDQRTDKAYEVEVGPLTSDEAAAIDQLFTSHEVMRYEPNDCDPSEPYLLQPILITEVDCEVELNGNEPNTVKFTWRYADNRPIVRFSASRGIFSSPYNIVFN